jgi:hypothetical protein
MLRRGREACRNREGQVLTFTLDDPEALTSGDLDGAAGRCGVG